MNFSKFLSFALTCLTFCFAVRMPIDPIEPVSIGSLAGFEVPHSRKVEAYYDNTRYCHHYPDIMCYRRDGNGWSPGDSGLWLLSSVTDRFGLGSIRVRFPQPYDDLDYDGDKYNGWFSPRCSHPVSGVTVLLTSFSPDVRIGHDGHLTYVSAVPMGHWSQDLYIEYAGEPLIRHFFAMRRVAIHTDQPPPPYDRHPPPYGGGDIEHPEL